MKSWNELTEQEQLLTTYSDYYKDVYGFRPSLKPNLSATDLQSKIDNLNEEAKNVWKFEEELRNEAIKDLEKTISETQNICNCTREKAIEFLMDAEEVDGDKEYFCYKMGIPYKYFEKEV